MLSEFHHVRKEESCLLSLFHFSALKYLLIPQGFRSPHNPNVSSTFCNRCRSRKMRLNTHASRLAPPQFHSTGDNRSMDEKPDEQDDQEEIISDDRPRWQRMLRAVFRPKPLMLAAMIVCAAILWPIVKANLPDLSQQPEYRLTASQIVINQPPHWVPHQFVDDAIERVGFPAEMSLLDENLTIDVAKLFAQHPWVAEVKEVRKASFPACLLVTLEYRRPVAMIEKRTGMYPIDARGVLLPKEDFSLSATADYLTITGVRSSPPSVQGEVWNDSLVQGAARVAAVLRTEWQALNLKAIVVPPRTTSEIKLADIEFTLMTTTGSSILWGRAPGVQHDRELSVTQKLDRLKTYLADHGSFDAPAGPYEIDIRHWQQISRKQIPAARDANLPKENL